MIVQFAGGLCNQMFQFAFGQSISAKRNEPVLYWKKDLDRGCARAYSLGAFCGTPQFSIAEPTSAWVERTFKFDPAGTAVTLVRTRPVQLDSLAADTATHESFTSS